jgi:hypothetical protein
MTPARNPMMTVQRILTLSSHSRPFSLLLKGMILNYLGQKLGRGENDAALTQP